MGIHAYGNSCIVGMAIALGALRSLMVRVCILMSLAVAHGAAGRSLVRQGQFPFKIWRQGRFLTWTRVEKKMKIQYTDFFCNFAFLKLINSP
jgi:hypothetical protein